MNVEDHEFKHVAVDKDQVDDKPLATESTVYDSAMPAEQESQLSRFALSSFMPRQDQKEAQDQLRKVVRVVSSICQTPLSKIKDRGAAQRKARAIFACIKKQPSCKFSRLRYHTNF